MPVPCPAKRDDLRFCCLVLNLGDDYGKHKEVLLYLFFGGLAVFLNLAAETDSTKGLVAQLTGFFGGRLLTLLLEELILGIFIVSLHWNRIGVKLAAQIFVIVANYVISKFFVFKKKD